LIPSVGQINLSRADRKNILLYRISDLPYMRITSTRQTGRIAIVTTRGLGCGGRGSVGATARRQGGQRIEPNP